MKVGVNVEVDLSTIDSHALWMALERREQDKEKLIISAWKNGELLKEIERMYGDYGRHVIELEKATNFRDVR